MIAALHAVIAGAWIGCVLVEVAFERTLKGQDQQRDLALAMLHWRVDCFIELPLLMLTLVSGSVLAAQLPTAQIQPVKLLLAFVTILANLACMGCVMWRMRAATDGDWDQFVRADRLQHQTGAAVLLGLLLTAAMGMHAAA